jgi:hypothetical protein
LSQLKGGKMASTGGTAPTRSTTESTGKKSPTWDEIQVRAYEIYRERGGTDGDDVQDWLQAERELQISTTPKSRESSNAATPSVTSPTATTRSSKMGKIDGSY